MLKDRAARMAFNLEARFGKACARGLGFDDALNSVAVLAYRAADAHSFYVMARNQANVLRAIEDPPIKAVLFKLHELAMLQHIGENAGDWIGILDETQVELVHDRIDELLGQIRPDAVALVDSFGFTDEDLHHTTLGRYDCNAYEAIYAAAKKSPLSQSDQMSWWDGQNGFGSVLNLEFLREGMTSQRAGPPAPTPFAKL